MINFRTITTAAIGSALGLFVAINGACAGVIWDFSAAQTDIYVGQPDQFNVTLTVTPDPGYSNALFTGGSLTFDSGDGQTALLPIASGLSTETFQQIFTYGTIGNFAADFSANVAFTEDLAGVSYPVSQLVSDPLPIHVHPTPEPTSLMLLAAGLVALGLIWRRKAIFGRAARRYPSGLAC
jgi:hypothetical protein